MEVVEIDPVGLEPVETLVALAVERCSRGVEEAGSIRIPGNPSFRRDDHFITSIPKSLMDECFALAVLSVAVGTIKEIDSCVRCCFECGEAIIFIYIQTRHPCNGPTSHGDRADLEVGLTQLTVVDECLFGGFQ